MISKHVNSLLLKILDNPKIHCTFNGHFEESNLDVNIINLNPQKDTDVVLELSNNKLITVNDLEFASLKDENNIILGKYRFQLVG